MTATGRRRLTLALLLSLLLHLSLLVAPGWYLPASDEALSSDSSLLKAHLAPAPMHRSAASASRSTSPPRRHQAMPVPAAAGTAAPTIESPPALPPNATGAPPADPAALAPEAIAPVVPAEPATPSPPPQARATTAEPALPSQGQIRFAISRGDQGFIVGQSLHRWSHDGKHYKLSNVTETTGIAALFRPAQVMQASEGEIGATGLRPIQFRTEKNGVAGDAARFDWAGMKLTLSGGSQRELPLVAGAQDMLSMFYQIGALLPWTPQESNQIMVATGRKFERYAFDVLGEETLTTKFGGMRTLHLHTGAGIEAIDVWSGLDLQGLPLKIRYTDRQGESFNQIAEDIEIDGQSVPTKNR